MRLPVRGSVNVSVGLLASAVIGVGAGGLFGAATARPRLHEDDNDTAAKSAANMARAAVPHRAGAPFIIRYIIGYDDSTRARFPASAPPRLTFPPPDAYNEVSRRKFARRAGLFGARSAAARAMRVTIYTKPGCHLCEDVEAKVRSVMAKAPFALETVNIMLDPMLQMQFAFDIPVVQIDGKTVATHFLNEETFENLIKKGSH